MQSQASLLLLLTLFIFGASGRRSVSCDISMALLHIIIAPHIANVVPRLCAPWGEQKGNSTRTILHRLPVVVSTWQSTLTRGAQDGRRGKASSSRLWSTIERVRAPAAARVVPAFLVVQHVAAALTRVGGISHGLNILRIVNPLCWGTEVICFRPASLARSVGRYAPRCVPEGVYIFTCRLLGSFRTCFS